MGPPLIKWSVVCIDIHAPTTHRGVRRVGARLEEDVGRKDAADDAARAFLGDDDGAKVFDVTHVSGGEGLDGGRRHGGVACCRDRGVCM